MAFMQMFVHRGDGWIAETDNGSVAIPDWNAPDVDDLRARVGQKVWIGDLYGTLESVEYMPNTTYWGRYSAPGYMDCTSWHWGETREEVEAELRAMYGEDDESEDDGDNGDGSDDGLPPSGYRIR